MKWIENEVDGDREIEREREKEKKIVKNKLGVRLTHEFVLFYIVGTCSVKNNNNGCRLNEGTVTIGTNTLINFIIRRVQQQQQQNKKLK